MDEEERNRVEAIIWIAEQARDHALDQAAEIVANAKIDKARKWDIVCAIKALTTSHRAGQQGEG